MSDIVTRLRESATQARAIDRSELLNEAADEIVKIRREVEDLRDTPPQHPAPGECSKPRDGTSEPVAWWVRGCEYDTGCEYEFVALLKEQAELAATQGGNAVPLYQSPSLTDAEREAVEIAVEYVGSAFQVEHHAAVLRGLLERLG